MDSIRLPLDVLLEISSMNACKIDKSEALSISLLLIDAREMARIPTLAFRVIEFLGLRFERSNRNKA